MPSRRSSAGETLRGMARTDKSRRSTAGVALTVMVGYGTIQQGRRGEEGCGFALHGMVGCGEAG
jgi:hypothetical protein